MTLPKTIGTLALALICGSATLAAIAFVASRPPSIPEAPPRIKSLEGVTLIEPGLSRRTARTIRFDGGQIDAIEGSTTSIGPFAGTYVLPGLTDMHLHMPMLAMPGDSEYTALLLLSQGVTTARLLGGTSAAETIGLRDRIDRGEIPGPRLFTCGPIIDGPGPVLPSNEVVVDAEQARALVARLAEEGVDCIKVYDKLSLESVTALREAAHAHGLPAVGHTPQDVALEDARLDDVQHLRGAHPPFEDERRVYPEYMRPWLRFDDDRFDHVLSVSRANGMAYTPTLVAIESMLRSRDWQSWQRSPAMRAWPSHLRDAVFSAEVGVNPGRFMSDEQAEMVQTAFDTMRRTVVRLHEAGIPLHTGTDSNVPNVVPGYALQRELVLWVEGGISPTDALAASTLRSPRALGISSGSPLSPGSAADLAIFREDPTQDIAALSTLAAVVRDGRLYTRGDLDDRLARYRAHYESASYRAFIVAPMRLLARVLTSVMPADEGASDLGA